MISMDIHEIWALFSRIFTLCWRFHGTPLHRLNACISISICEYLFHRFEQILTWAYLGHRYEHKMCQLLTARFWRCWPPAGLPNPYRGRYVKDTHWFRIWMVNTCINTDMDGYGQIWTDMNIFQKYLPNKMKEFHITVSAMVRALTQSGQSLKVLGSILGMDKGILDFWGAYRQAFSENKVKTKKLLEKLSFCSPKIKFLDMNRYAQICTDMDRYAQICTDILIYGLIQDWQSDTLGYHLIFTICKDINIFTHIYKIWTISLDIHDMHRY